MTNEKRDRSYLERITIKHLKAGGMKHTEALRKWREPHTKMIVDGEIEVCSTCVNSEGNPVGWGYVHDDPNHVK